MTKKQLPSNRTDKLPITNARSLLGLSAKDFGALFQVTASMVKQWESGRKPVQPEHTLILQTGYGFDSDSLSTQKKEQLRMVNGTIATREAIDEFQQTVPNSEELDAIVQRVCEAVTKKLHDCVRGGRGKYITTLYKILEAIGEVKGFEEEEFRPIGEPTKSTFRLRADDVREKLNRIEKEAKGEGYRKEKEDDDDMMYAIFSDPKIVEKIKSIPGDLPLLISLEDQKFEPPLIFCRDEHVHTIRITEYIRRHIQIRIMNDTFAITRRLFIAPDKF